MRKNIKIGLFGFGCVGKGLYDVLHQTPGLKAEIVKICVKDRTKKRAIDDKYFTFDKDEILNNPEINVIVELIDDPVAAKDIVITALQKKKAVVTANKKMVAENLKELLILQNKYKTPLLYEGAVCASIPIIRNLEEYYDNDLLKSIKGIVNGTTNYILTKMFAEKINFESALDSAKENGFAETDSSLDIDGFDAKYKLDIILAHAYGLLLEPKELTNIGISRINGFDANYAEEKGSKIKLIAHSYKLDNNRIASFVMPQFIQKENELYGVDNVFNGIITESCFADKNVFIGKGAGAFPTASAVLSDISALTYNYKYEYKKLIQNLSCYHTNDIDLEVYVRTGVFKDSDLNLFSSITEKYQSSDTSFIIGTINLNLLKNSGWIENPKYSIILKDIKGVQ